VVASTKPDWTVTPFEGHSHYGLLDHVTWVRSSGERERTDTDFAVDVAAALGRLVIDGHVAADVIDHVVVLDGEVRGSLDREEAEAAVSAIHGVLNVVNRVSIGPPAEREDVEHQIVEAFTLRASRRAEAIVVEADDGHVVLRGNVGALSERSLAERAAWATPGVRSVKNHLHVQPS
jgi:osmotically-inducible protein OsmY